MGKRDLIRWVRGKRRLEPDPQGGAWLLWVGLLVVILLIAFKGG